MFARWGHHFQRLWRSEDGVAAAFVAMLLFVMMGMAALAIDLSHAYANRQMMQTAADAAAISGAIARGHNLTSQPDGLAAAADSGWTHGGDISVSITDAGNKVIAVVQ